MRTERNDAGPRQWPTPADQTRGTGASYGRPTAVSADLHNVPSCTDRPGVRKGEQAQTPDRPDHRTLAGLRNASLKLWSLEMTGQRHPPSGRGAKTRKEKQREHRCPLETGGSKGSTNVQSAQATRPPGAGHQQPSRSGAQSPPADPGAPGRPSTTSAGTSQGGISRTVRSRGPGRGLAAPHPAACPHTATPQHRAEGCRQPPARVPGRWEEGPTARALRPASPMGLSMVVLTPAPPRGGRWRPRGLSPADGPLPCAGQPRGALLRHQDR